MTTITTRAVKGSPLTNQEVDDNFTNLNNDKLEIVINGVTSGSTITPAVTDTQYNVTALAVGATIAAPTGTPVSGHKLLLRIKDNGSPRALNWTTSAGGYRAIGVTLPTTTVASKILYIGCTYNSTDNYWDVTAVGQQA